MEEKGLMAGLDSVLTKPPGELVQLYECPGTALSPRIRVWPAQVVSGGPTLAVGKGLTVIFTELVLLQPVVTINSFKEYVVVVFGVSAIWEDVEVKPVGVLVQL